MKNIPQGLRLIYVIDGIYAFVFGFAGVFAPRFVGDLAGHPVHDVDVNMMLGAMGLAISFASFYAYRAARWDQISILTAMSAFCAVAIGLGGLAIYFAPSVVGVDRFPVVLLIVAIVELVLGIALTYYYHSVQGWNSPLRD